MQQHRQQSRSSPLSPASPAPVGRHKLGSSKQHSLPTTSPLSNNSNDDEDTPSPSISSLSLSLASSSSSSLAQQQQQQDPRQKASHESAIIYEPLESQQIQLDSKTDTQLESRIDREKNDVLLSSSSSLLSSPCLSNISSQSSSSSRRGRSRSDKHKFKPPLKLPVMTEALQRFTLYETRRRYYLIGSSLSESIHRLLKIDRLTMKLDIQEDPTNYTATEIGSLLSMINTGNSGDGGIINTMTIYGVIGFIRFLLGYHLYVITGIQEVARIGGHIIYTITDTQLLSVTHPSLYESSHSNVHRSPINNRTENVDNIALLYKKHKTNEAKYKSLFSMMDLTKFFYFSYTYDLTHTLQINMIAAGNDHNNNNGTSSRKAKQMYIWNHFLMLKPSQSLSAKNTSNTASSLYLPLHRSDWCVSLLHGYVEQSTLSIIGHPITLTLIARRSRYFAGTRYLKRGINNSGQAANDVETEQILHDRYSGDSRDGNFTSYVTMRGSIPVHWTQESNAIIAQPAIVLQKLDPLHLATRRHIQDIWTRYGSPLLILNLVKQAERRKREGIIGTAYGEAIQFINQWLPIEHQIDYLAWDFKKVSKSATMNVMDELTIISHWALQRTGLFQSRPKHDAQMVFPNNTYILRPTRESLTAWGLQGLPTRKQEAAASSVASSSYIEQHALKDIRQMEEEYKETLEHNMELLSTPTSSSPPSLLASSSSFNLSSLPSFNSLYSIDEQEIQGQDTVRTLEASRLSPQASRSSPSSFTPSDLSPSSIPIRSLSNIAYLQRGVCRANCVDSLDRTNAAIYCLGKCALGYQLHALSLISYPVADNFGQIGSVLLDMYERMGDALALQYGGSQMHRQVKNEANHNNSNTAHNSSITSAMPAIHNPSSQAHQRSSLLPLLSSFRVSKPKEFIVSLVRHYQNSFQDTGKQDTMNLFLGLFHPSSMKDGLHLWEMGSDYYLHNEPQMITTQQTQEQEENQQQELQTMSRTQVMYEDDQWWKQPILDYEQKLGVFALHPNQLFPFTTTTLPTSKSLSISASSPAVPALPSVISASEADSQTDTQSHRAASVPSPKPSHQLSTFHLNLPSPNPSCTTSSISCSSISCSSSSCSSSSSSSSMTTESASPSLSSTPSSFNNSSQFSSSSHLSSPSLRFLSQYGSPSELTEFDELISPTSILSSSEIIILGNNNNNDVTNIINNKDTAAVDKDKDKEPTKAIQWSAAGVASTASSLVAATIIDGRRKLNKAVEKKDLIEEDDRIAWDKQQSQIIVSQHEEKMVSIYSLDSSYALSSSINSSPHISTEVKDRYNRYVRMDVADMLVPESTVLAASLMVHQMAAEADQQNREIQHKEYERQEKEIRNKAKDRNKKKKPEEEEEKKDSLNNSTSAVSHNNSVSSDSQRKVSLSVTESHRSQLTSFIMSFGQTVLSSPSNHQNTTNTTTTTTMTSIHSKEAADMMKKKAGSAASVNSSPSSSPPSSPISVNSNRSSTASYRQQHHDHHHHHSTASRDNKEASGLVDMNPISLSSLFALDLPLSESQLSCFHVYSLYESFTDWHLNDWWKSCFKAHEAEIIEIQRDWKHHQQPLDHLLATIYNIHYLTNNNNNNNNNNNEPFYPSNFTKYVAEELDVYQKYLALR